MELAGLTMGIVGCGRIGQATARLADVFGMKVIGNNGAKPARSIAGIEPVSLDDLFARRKTGSAGGDDGGPSRKSVLLLILPAWTPNP